MDGDADERKSRFPDELCGRFLFVLYREFDCRLTELLRERYDLARALS